jgi:hypothetical protein
MTHDQTRAFAEANAIELSHHCDEDAPECVCSESKIKNDFRSGDEYPGRHNAGDNRCESRSIHSPCSHDRKNIAELRKGTERDKNGDRTSAVERGSLKKASVRDRNPIQELIGEAYDHLSRHRGGKCDALIAKLADTLRDTEAFNVQLAPATGKIIAVDLDGTLAEHHWPRDGRYDPLRIGKPVPRMIAHIKKWLAAEENVCVFTARVDPANFADDKSDALASRQAVIDSIRHWTHKHIGQPIEPTCVKSAQIKQIWDDRAVRVRRNEGEPCCDFIRD